MGRLTGAADERSGFRHADSTRLGAADGSAGTLQAGSIFLAVEVFFSNSGARQNCST